MDDRKKPEFPVIRSYWRNLGDPGKESPGKGLTSTGGGVFSNTEKGRFQMV